jgi:hypothetical protein
LGEERVFLAHARRGRSVSVVSVASEQAYGTCASCGSALVSDQRYCLECGAPVSPVRLAFLDVLQNGQELAVRQPAGYDGTVIGAAGVLPAADPFGQSGVNSWLRRNSGILSLLSVLALCLIAGLLIGHWASRGAPSKQVVELKGLPASASLPASTTAPSSSSTATKSGGAKAAGNSKAEEEAEERTEARESAAEKAPPPAAKKVNLNKLSKSTGKKHQEEIEANGAAPIETG